MSTIQAYRLQEIAARSLGAGSHDNISAGMCVMEAASYVAGEPWSDAPQCACPVIAAFMVSWSDSLPDDESRNRLLKPLIPVIVGTRSTAAVEQRRATMAADWLIRVHAPAWLRQAQLETQAQALESLPEITDFAQCPSLMSTLNAVRKDAAAAWNAADWDATRDAAWVATRDAAWGAAWDAAWNAADWDATRDATRAAAWDAARAAAWAATRDAAWVATRDALQATTAQLQTSAVDLVRRMCEVKE